jgi:Family of unknown function (DUF5681)
MTIGKPFQKGQSGNPGGRPKAVAEIKDLARKHTDEALETLAAIMRNPKASAAARVSAANALLDRGYGKPPQHITVDEGISYVARLPEVAKSAKEWIASVKVERSLPSDQASSKLDARIEGQRGDYLLLESKKSAAD